MKKPFLFLIVFLFLNILPIFGQKPNNLNKFAVTSSYSKFNINNISTHVYSNGFFDFASPYGGDSFIYPKTEGLPLLWESGLVWGGKIGDSVFVGGTYYNTTLIQGKILENGVPLDPNNSSAKIRRIRRDYVNADLSFESKDLEISEDEIRSQYQTDWNEWPAENGAPFDDLDNNGIYDPQIDIPGVPGAHQTIWYVANDFDTTASKEVLGSNPMKLEVQVTVWGYNIPQTVYDNVMFKKYKITNKNNVDIDSMYLSKHAHTNLFDGFIGVDTVVDLGYLYNGDGLDEYFYGSSVPAVGFQFLQGPIVNSPGDVAYSSGQYINNYKNLRPNAFYDFSDHLWVNPDIRNYERGTIPYYFNMQGLHRTGEKIQIPEIVGTGTTTFPYSGNPITREGWIDGLFMGPSYRGLSYSIGPFKLEVGESQEIVIAQIAAMGRDHLNSVALLKYYADILKSEYPSFNLSNPIPNIDQLVPTIFENKYRAYDIIELKIERKDSIEGFSKNGYSFQGYNIYQSERPTKFKNAAHKLFTFDKGDDVTNIYGNSYDPLTGYQINDLLYSGTNSGLAKKITIDKDHLLDSPLLKGKTYYFGISSYYYNQDEDKTLESPLDTLSVVYQKDLPGPRYLDSIESQKEIGNSDAKITLEVVNPYELTGDEYEITFGQQHYYLDSDNEWKKTNYHDKIGKFLNKPVDQTPSTLIPLPSIYAPNSTLDLHFMVENNAPDYNYIDAISLTFPDEITINYANNITSNHDAESIIDGQIITWGKTGKLSADGPFTGGEELIVNINYVDPTFAVDYIIYDDGWSEAYAETDSQYYKLGDGTVNGYGTVKLTGEVGYKFKQIKYWELSNKTKNEKLLDEQIMYSSFDYNPWRDTRWWDNSMETFNDESILEGFKIKVSGSFDPPTFISKIGLAEPINPKSIFAASYGPSDSSISINNIPYFGSSNSWAISSFGVGTTDVEQLQQDYEIRFTGVYDEGTKIGDQTVYKVTEGGQMATCFRMNSTSDLAIHPLNPNPGKTEPFLMRIPFEVWNVEDPNNPFQINVTFIDRNRSGNENPFYAWNPNNRMYPIIVNSPYNQNQIIQVDNGPDKYNAFATWALVFWGTNYNLGDVVLITYANPIQYTDVITFTTPEAPTDKIFPNKYEIFQNYPNPFNPNTKIRYYIPEDGNVKITIYNILGQKVTEVINKTLKAGKYETEFNGSNFASGVYIYRIEVDSPNKANIYSQTKKMLLLK